MAVVINKPKMQDKSIDLLKETAQNVKKNVAIEIHKEG